MLLGRRFEREQIERVLAAARAGDRQVLVLRGEAGIGKSALLAHAREQATAMRVLDIRGVESEAELAFAGLTELLRPVADEIARLPDAQADALRAALAQNAEPANPLAVRMALLSLLAALADVAPVLVTADDVQWIDRSSLDALAFAVRRLNAEGVGVVAAVRGDEPVALEAEPAVVLEVTGLDDADALVLLGGRGDVSGAAAERLVRTAGGNPLALLELPDVVDDGGALLAGIEPPAVGPQVRRAFQDRLDRLPAASRLAVGVVAADAAASLGDVVGALGALGLPIDSLDPAEHEGLVRIDGDRVELRHALLRSVSYHSLSAPERREVHRALASTMGRSAAAAAERRTWHQAAATLGHDEQVALALDEVARSAERRGAIATAAHGFDRAAGLSAPGDDRARRLLHSADMWLAAGHWDLALDQLDRAVDLAVAPDLRADIAASSGQLEAYRAGPERGASILVAAADRIEHDDPARATRLLTYATNAAVFATDADRATALARRAAECGERAGGLHVVAGAMAGIEAALLTGDPDLAARVAPLGQLADALIDSELDDGEHVFGLVVLADFFLEEWERAERLLDVLLQRARDTGRLFLLAFALTIRADLDWRRGRWTDAYATATTEVWETPLELPGVGAWLYAVQARIEAGLGLASDAEAHGTAALAVATDTGTHAVEVWAAASLGFLELGRSRPLAAVEHLARVAETLERGRVGEPGLLWWAADLIEAQWRVGDLGAARRRLEVLEHQASTSGRVWAGAAVRRASGLLASTPDAAEAAFADAMGWHDRLPAPFEKARTLLLWGECRRAFGRDDADAPLQRARVAFERLGADPWTAQARRLLGDDADQPVAVVLTRQERQVAAIVGHGATNREAADRLFLSPRTIDFHLRNIYKKLQIRSRTELAVHLAREGTAADDEIAGVAGVGPASR